MYEIVIPCIIIVVIFAFAYIKIRHPFWNVQPAFHNYDVWRYLYSKPFIIQLYLPIKTKFYDPVQVQTIDYLEDFSDQKKQFIDLLQCHYIPSDRIQFTVTKETVDPYFVGHQFPPMISFFNEKRYQIDPLTKKMTIICQDAPIGAMTSRSLIFHYSNTDGHTYTKEPIYYWDFICINREHKTKKIVRNLIQTHEFNQRTKEPNIRVSIFKKEIDLCDGIVPLAKFDTYTFYVKNGNVEPLPAHFTLVRVLKENISVLIDVFSELLNGISTHAFDICLLPDISSIVELIRTNQLYVYCLKRCDDVYALYFIKDAKMNYDDFGNDGNTLHLVASIKNMKSVDLFQVGFFHCLKDILKRNQSYKMLMMENVGDNRFIVDEWRGNGSTVLFKTASAYYLYNMVYPMSPVSAKKCLILV